MRLNELLDWREVRRSWRKGIVSQRLAVKAQIRI